MPKSPTRFADQIPDHFTRMEIRSRTYVNNTMSYPAYCAIIVGTEIRGLHRQLHDAVTTVEGVVPINRDI